MPIKGLSEATMDLSQIPAAAPPPGVTPDFNSSDNYQHRNIILHSMVLSATTVAVIVRLYTRAVIKKNVGADDWLALLSWADSRTRIWNCYGLCLFAVAHSFAKVVFLPYPVDKTVYLVRVLAHFQNRPRHKWGIWLGMMACTVFYLVTFFVDIFRCKPVASAWNPTIKGKCMSYAAFPWATGIFNFISDFYILMLPLPPILRMNMSLIRRLRIASIFGLSLFTCVASIMRFVVSRQYALDPDQTYVAAKVLHWTVLEINIGLICACATTFPAFFDSTAPRSFSSLVGSLLSKRSASRTNFASPPGSDEGCGGSGRSSDEQSQGRNKKG
ncbi:hypothetical protein CC86DRAFT_415931 [Ophiobolus disseminans]|uniref:Rhodopsin domain-containing protein n=1 Tax=Ophiobolus disseminans TaxID=1469910 RepID=A0A6A7ALT0_9PLEO|nr:hypothetical protein CC86DRAFT_415931 [Ophiobolus disseminans]